MKNIVVIGGGTGTYTVLRGLKKYTLPTAIISMMDNGGSSGKLRDEYGVLPPGDFTRCILALSEENEFIRGFYGFRFNGGLLKEHTVRNLIFTALFQYMKEKGRNCESEFIKEIHNMFKVRGYVCPVTYDSVHLMAELENGETIVGETNIDIPKHDSRVKRVYLEPEAFASVEALSKIKDAELIVIGPGDLYTSVIPNLLVNGIDKEILESNAKKVYICNLMTKRGETDEFKASDHLREVEKYLGGEVDLVICNNKRPSDDYLNKYVIEGKTFVEPDLEDKVIKADLLNEIELLRHDPDKLARCLMSI